ncbi:hypothetical protein VTO42DRAFT_3419 [Malbranchea cinnamomea]
MNKNTMATQNFFHRVKSSIYHLKPVHPQTEPSPEPEPVLDNDDEMFLNRVVSESLPAAAAAADVPVTTEAHDAQMASLDAAKNTPLPPTPAAEQPKEPQRGGEGVVKAKGASQWTPKRVWGMLRRSESPENKEHQQSHPTGPSEDVTQGESAEPAQESETAREQRDLADVLDKLNLATLNNRVFSLNQETQTLLWNFKLILKDMLNGVPEAYDDLESLFKSRDEQLEALFNSLPGFLQKVIMTLPESLAPELLATLAAKAEKGRATSAKPMGKGGDTASTKPKITSLSAKDLVTKPAAVLGFLRSITVFLRARFPALLGMNVFWSLALCLLLLSLWYCHKRGREVRLEKEAADAAQQGGGSIAVDAQQSTSRLSEAETQPSTIPADTSAEPGAAGLAQVDRAVASSPRQGSQNTRQTAEPSESERA